MARIRSIKPEFPQSETIGKLSRDARLLFIELWTIADDSGRSRAASRMLASLLFPYDDDARELLDGWMDELVANGCVEKYTIDGDSYLQICNWLKHQKIDHPGISKIPGPRESSRKTREASRSLAPDLGSRKESLHLDLDPTLTIKNRTSIESCPSQARTSPVSRCFDEFWEMWPNKVGKPAARKSFERIAKQPDFDQQAILLGIERYRCDKPPDRPWLNPATFLNQERWLDQPARASPNGHGRSNGSGGATKAFLEGDDDTTGREEGPGKTIPLLPTEWRRE